MSLADLDPAAARAGRIDCACGPLAGEGGKDQSGAYSSETYSSETYSSEAYSSETWRLTLGFGFAVLAQALMLSTLPVAGMIIAPHPALAYIPYALTLLGAALASFPASLLLDQFGRRAAFALGASLGMAGGLLAGWAIISRNFPGLCVGALWLGVAQGFALFYRHAAASSRAGGSRAALTVLAGGCAASLFVPATIALSRQTFGPLADAALMLLAGIASFAPLPFMLALPHRLADRAEDKAPDGFGASFWPATGIGACAWFAMAHVMTGAPSALIGCGFGTTIVGGLVSWHLIAMYGPMALAAHRRTALPTALAIGAGAGLLALAFALPRAGAITIELCLILAGVGWSLTQISLSRILYDGRGRSRPALAFHDTIILGSALLGVLSAAT